MPLMQLKSVVLPAPLGPMSPTISPDSMVSETSRLATRPPNRLVHDSTSRRGGTASASGRRRGRAVEESAHPAPPWQREEPVGAPARDQHDDGAVDDEVDPTAGQRARAECG